MCTRRLRSFAALAAVAFLCDNVAAAWSLGQAAKKACSQSHGAGGTCGVSAEAEHVLLATSSVLSRVRLELQEPTPEPAPVPTPVPAPVLAPAAAAAETVLITETVHRGSVLADGGATRPSAASARFPVADLADLLAETGAFGVAAAEAEASARAGGDARTALVSKRAAEAAARDAESFAAGLLALFNPSLVEMPVSWRRRTERWLGVFRQQTTSSNRNESIPTWYSSSIVLAVLDEDFHLARPLRVLQSRDFFRETFDCQLQGRDHSYFGPEDARIFAEQQANGSERVFLFFNARTRSRRPNEPCELSGGQRMYAAELAENLKPISVGKIHVPGEGSPRHSDRPEFPAGEAAPLAGRLAAVEKNWSPFMYQAPAAGAPLVLLEYSIEPHVVMDFDASGHRAGGRGLWRSESAALGAWLQHQGSTSGQAPTVHGGVSPILIDHQAEQTNVYLSVLHTRDSESFVYRNYFYLFEAKPPFAILAVGEKELPAKRQPCSWGALVAFPTSLLRMEGRDGPELWVLYGSGDDEAHRLVFSWSELQALLPPLPHAATPQAALSHIGMLASGGGRGGHPLIMTDGRDEASARPEVLLTVAETRHLKEEIAAWTSDVAGGPAKASSNRTVEIRRRMQLAAASEMASLQGKVGFSNLYNPSMVELPASWRRPGEKWLAVFRDKQESAASNAEGDAEWYSFSLVLAILDDAMRPVRPARRLRSEDLFGHGGFDCQLAETDTAYFGPADARIFLDPGDEKGNASEALLFFTSRVLAAEPNTPCPAHGGQRMFMARINHNLTTSSAAPLLIPGEEEPQDAFFSAGSRTAGAAPHEEGSIAGVGRLKSVDKNWAPFSYSAPKVSNASRGRGQSARTAAQTLMEYTVEPHVIMDLEASSHRVGGKHIWKTSSSAVRAWLARRNAQYGETHAAASASDIHGGAGALLVQTYAGRPKVFVSVLHARFTDRTGKQTYHSYMYTFEAAPPFRILGVAEKELPLVKKPCRWGAAVAFPMSLTRAEGPRGAEFQLLYGSGDSEAHRLVMSSAELESFLPARHDLVPGLTLVMMSHSRKRFQDLREILRHYRAMNPGLLEEIILIWNNPQDPGAVEELQLLNSGEGVPMQVILADVNSMNNRFAVWETVSTEGVIIQDDDMWVDEADLSCLVDVWRAEPQRLVGASNERTHMEHNATGHLREMSPRCNQVFHLDDGGNKVYTNDTSCTFWGEEYSMLLPHPWVLSRRYMQLYTENGKGTELVDSMLNCDDIYLNAVVSNYTRASPVAVNVSVHRYPTWSDGSAMWVSDNRWGEHRGQCLERVNSYYRGEPMSPDTGTVFRLANRSFACPAASDARALPVGS